MSDLLSIGASGVRAYQTALATVGENIANAGVSGYSRRTVSLTEISTGQGLAVDAGGAGNGVLVGSISRSGDVYATAAVRSASADLARTKTASTWLGRIESALTGDQVSERLTAFFGAASSLAAEPASTALRANLLGTATSTAAAFTATGDAFDQIDADLDAQAGQAAQSLTSLASSLARVNDGLGRTQTGTAAAAQLADQRDQILDQMSAYAEVSSTTDAVGRATVKLGGTAGATIVSLNNAGTVSFARGDDASLNFTVRYGGTETQLSTEGGAIAGMMDGAQRIAAARATVNGIASGFVDTVNSVQKAGDDINGNAGEPLFEVDGNPTDIRVALTDGSGIAAAVRGGTVRDASNLTTLQSARIAKGFEASTTSLITSNAAAIAQKDTIAEAQTSIRDGAVSVLSGATGVTLDSEAVDLMRFQQAYSASSRVIQVARDIFNSILEIR